MSIKIILNGQKKELTASINVYQLINQFCAHQRAVIAEINKEIIHKDKWQEKILNEGDVVELINIVGGG